MDMLTKNELARLTLELDIGDVQSTLNDADEIMMFGLSNDISRCDAGKAITHTAGLMDKIAQAAGAISSIRERDPVAADKMERRIEDMHMCIADSAKAIDAQCTCSRH